MSNKPSGPPYVLRNGKWVKPKAPSGGGYHWNETKGWVSKATQAEEFGYQIGLINSDTGKNSLSEVFNQAWQAELSGQAWDQSKFNNAIKKTNWYKNRTAAQRQYDIAYGTGKGSPEYTDLMHRVSQQTASVQQIAGNLGIQLSQSQINQIGHDAVRNGYTNAELNSILAKAGESKGIDNFYKQVSGGTVGTAKNDIQNWAKDNGVTISNSWLSGQLDEITRGTHDVQKSKDYITGLAKLAYPAHADYLDSKTSVMDRAQTYAQKISSMLEVPFENVDLTNQHLKNALNPGEDGKAKNVTQVEQELRGTADWAKTNNAKETVNGMVNNILNKFGLV